jgi:D-glycero-D-manno-heptose 1,7-bisphosphate phosphatase
MTGRVSVFLDRDGVINEKAPEGCYVTRPEGVRMLPGAADAIARLNKAGLLVLLVTNQRGIGRGLMTEQDFWAVMNRIDEELGRAGAHLDGVYYCADVNEASAFRKPNIGMIQRALQEHPETDISRSYLVGDSESDMLAGLRVGCRPLLVGNNSIARGPARAAFPDLASAVTYILAGAAGHGPR